MTSETDKTLDEELEVFFEASRVAAPDPSPEMLARVLADAYSAQDAIEIEAPATAPETSRRAGLGGVFSAIGGWPAMAGLVTATAAGIWIGYNPPSTVDTLTQPLLGSVYNLTMDSSLPDIDFLLADG
ncbi:hypothetical protein [Tropicimonas marinistellae]|uniref:hypothetical protein n=1 Tax=Tropicimonas marinistellae TaxID=1739787 RepID=UPI00083665D1|nr:hypothetical protein [Tropicimonas marinistellae]